MRNKVRIRKLIKNRKFGLALWWTSYFILLFALSFVHIDIENNRGFGVFNSKFEYNLSLFGHVKSALIPVIGTFISCSLGLLVLKDKALGKESAIAYSLFVGVLMVLSIFPAILYDYSYKSIPGVMRISPVLVYIGSFMTSLALTGFHYLLKVLEQRNQLIRANRMLRSKSQQLCETKAMLEEVKQEETIYMNDRVQIGNKGRYKIVHFNEIVYLKSEKRQNHPYLYLIDGTRIMGDRPLKEFCDILSKDYFKRVHRSFIVAKKKVIERSRNSITKQDKLIIRLNGEKQKIPVGPHYKEDVDNDPILGWGIT